MDDIKIALNRLLTKIRAEIPTKVSELENDSGYLTSKELGEGAITEFIVLDQADYDALAEKNATTLYLIRG